MPPYKADTVYWTLSNGRLMTILEPTYICLYEMFLKAVSPYATECIIVKTTI
jgi:hypothetical protein